MVIWLRRHVRPKHSRSWFSLYPLVFDSSVSTWNCQVSGDVRGPERVVLVLCDHTVGSQASQNAV